MSIATLADPQIRLPVRLVVGISALVVAAGSLLMMGGNLTWQLWLKTKVQAEVSASVLPLQQSAAFRADDLAFIKKVLFRMDPVAFKAAQEEDRSLAPRLPKE